jgi:hypothetical protein
MIKAAAFFLSSQGHSVRIVLIIIHYSPLHLHQQLVRCSNDEKLSIYT